MKEAGIKALLKLCGKYRNTLYPNGVRARFLIPSRYVKKPHTKIKIDQPRPRQQLFAKYIVSSETWCISNLYFPAGPKKKTLHEIIMAIKVKDMLDQPLFLNVDKYWSGNGYSLHLLPQFEQETTMMIGNFIPYVIYHEDQWIEALFSTEFLMASSGNK